MKGRGKRLTWVHKALCRPGADGSSCSWRWRRERRTSCRLESRCQAPTANPPLGYPASGCRRSRSRTDACPAKPAESTSSRCSPGGQRGESIKRSHFKDKLVTINNADSISTTEPKIHFQQNVLTIFQVLSVRQEYVLFPVSSSGG